MTDIILDRMIADGVPLTRENYLHIAYCGDPPEPLSAEEEAELPPQFRIGWEDADEDE